MGVDETLRDVAFTVVRLTSFTANALLFGTAAILLLVLRPSFASLDATWDPGRKALGERLEGLIQAALTASAVATAIGLLLQAILVAEIRGTGLEGSTFTAMASDTFGQWWLLRFPVLAALFVLLVGRLRNIAFSGAGNEARGPGKGFWATWLVLALSLLATSSFSGHAAVAKPVPLSLFNDLVHLTSGAIWFTGIVVLAVLLPDGWSGKPPGERIALLAPAVTRFSVVAAITIGLVAVTGTLNSFLDVGSLSDLADTGYGRALTVKIILFLLILGLGAINHFILRHRLQRAQESGSSTEAENTFRRTIAAELAIGLFILGMTGLLTGLARTKGSTQPSPSNVTSGQKP